MGIFQSDVLIQETMRLIIDDIRNNLWLIDDILSDFVTNPYLAQKYGQKEIERCKEWFKNNEIRIFLTSRLDKVTFPCISIDLNPTKEEDSLSTMGDLSPSLQDFSPSQINNPIPYIIEPFTPISYDKNNGFLSVSSDIDLTNIAFSMVVVNPENGYGYLLDKFDIINDVQGFYIQKVNGEFPDFTFNKVGILPRYQGYRARIEASRFSESYTIGCHCAGDPSTLLWLYSIALYGLMRYREGLLEYSGFSISSLTSSMLGLNPSFGLDNVYSRDITISGIVQHSWIKTPRRFIEKAVIGLNGIKVIAPIPEIDADDNGIWTTNGEENV